MGDLPCIFPCYREFAGETIAQGTGPTVCRAANIASVQIGAGTNFRCTQLPNVLASRLVVSDTADASTLISVPTRSLAINLPAPLP